MARQTATLSQPAVGAPARRPGGYWPADGTHGTGDRMGGGTTTPRILLPRPTLDSLFVNQVQPRHDLGSSRHTRTPMRGATCHAGRSCARRRPYVGMGAAPLGHTRPATTYQKEDDDRIQQWLKARLSPSPAGSPAAMPLPQAVIYAMNFTSILQN